MTLSDPRLIRARALLVLATLAVCLGAAAKAGQDRPIIRVLPEGKSGKAVIGQGRAFLVRIEDPGRHLASAKARWDGQTIPCLPRAERALWLGLGGVGREQKPGRYNLDLVMEFTNGKKITARKSLAVARTDFASTSLTVDPAMVKIPPGLQKKVAQDRAAFAAVWAKPSYARSWKGPFLRPVPGRVTSPFGERRVYNGELRGVHRGVDLAGPIGEPVRAAAAAKVALVRKTYLEGNTVVLDHGGGLFTYYCHLSAFKVKPGQKVKTGQVIGLVGMTGRVTGPHLHWGCRVQGVKVDALSLLDLSRWLKNP